MKTIREFLLSYVDPSRRFFCDVCHYAACAHEDVCKSCETGRTISESESDLDLIRSVVLSTKKISCFRVSSGSQIEIKRYEKHKVFFLNVDGVVVFEMFDERRAKAVALSVKDIAESGDGTVLITEQKSGMSRFYSVSDMTEFVSE